MNIGGRINLRLNELGWERSDLLAKVPDLSPQALSNLIRRDSVRSEWDEVIANALGVSLLWLVYGKEEKNLVAQEPTPTPYIAQLSSEEAFLVQAYRVAGKEAKSAMMFLARTALPDQPDLDKRTGTD